MKYMDMHCDTLMHAFFEQIPGGITDCSGLRIDLKRMPQHVMAQFFAVYLPSRESFVERGRADCSDDAYISALRTILFDSLEKSDSVRFALGAEDVEKNEKEGFSSAILSMEDGRAVQGSMERLEEFYQAGFRAIALTWNFPNCFGFPNSQVPEEMAKGLTPFGKDAVRYMQELGMLVDVSHLSDGGFYDVADICKKPFVATHSNARAISPHRRNLTDDMIRRVGMSGGVIGLNLYPCFVEPDITLRATTAGMVARHARHIADIGGIDCVAIGTDFDGFHGEIDIRDCTQMDRLFAELKGIGFSEEDIEKIAYRNVLRVMRDAM